jgi:hypothetical protein
MKPLNINDLCKYCLQEIKKGNGNKTIMISSDDEGNSYHYLWYAFTTIEETEKPLEIDGQTYQEKFMFAEEDVAPKKDTIILG